MPVEGVARNEGDARGRGGAARRGAARLRQRQTRGDAGRAGGGWVVRGVRDVRGRPTGRTGGEGEARNDGAARRGAARRGEAKCGVRRPRATATMREARREVTEGR